MTGYVTKPREMEIFKICRFSFCISIPEILFIYNRHRKGFKFSITMLIFFLPVFVICIYTIKLASKHTQLEPCPFAVLLFIGLEFHWKCSHYAIATKLTFFNTLSHRGPL